MFEKTGGGIDFADLWYNLIYFVQKGRNSEVFNKWQSNIFQIPTQHPQITSRWYLKIFWLFNILSIFENGDKNSRLNLIITSYLPKRILDSLVEKNWTSCSFLALTTNITTVQLGSKNKTQGD